MSESISKDIIASDLIGYKFEDIQISKSEEYLEKIEMHPELNLPNFKRLVPLRNMTIDNNKITGYTEGNDFFMANGLDLVVSYSVDYGLTKESGQLARSILKEMISKYVK